MATERTLSIIKPDGVKKNVIGKIIAMFEEKGLKVAAAKLVQLTRQEAEGFYAVHRERPFFPSLVKFMTEGRIIALALEREDAVKKLREVMGATNPANAAEGTIRKKFAGSIERNCIHGSDAPETAAVELNYFFSALDLQ